MTSPVKYSVLAADPPWPYHDLGHTRRVDRIYPLMKIEDICALRSMIDRLALPNCALFLWATAPLLPEALTVIEAWGFKYRTHGVWDKERVAGGHYWRGQHELLLLGIKGKPSLVEPSVVRKRSIAERQGLKPPKEVVAVHNLPSIFREHRREHSRKPEIAYRHIEAMYPEADKLELFARHERAGWDAWGNELNGNGKSISVPSLGDIAQVNRLAAR